MAFKNLQGSGKIICIGECMVEFFKNNAETWKRGFAGDTLNVAWAMRAILPKSISIEYITRVGSDYISDEMIEFMKQSGLSTSHIFRDLDRTVGLYCISTDENGERTFTYWRDNSAARKIGGNLAILKSQLNNGRLVYLSGITAAVIGNTGRENILTALEEAKKMGTIIAYDPNYRPSLWKDKNQMQIFTEKICALVDIMLPTFNDEMEGFDDETYLSAINRIRSWGPSEIILKNGVEPTAIFTSDKIDYLEIKKPKRALDTTGAGDSFNGTYLACRLLGKLPLESAQAAQSISALVVQNKGALISQEKIKQFSLIE